MKKLAGFFLVVLVAFVTSACSSVNDSVEETGELAVQVVTGQPDTELLDELEVINEEGEVVASDRHFVNRMHVFELPRGNYTVRASTEYETTLPQTAYVGHGRIEHETSFQQNKLRATRRVSLQGYREISLDLTEGVTVRWSRQPGRAYHDRYVKLIVSDPHYNERGVMLDPLSSFDFKRSRVTLGDEYHVLNQEVGGMRSNDTEGPNVFYSRESSVEPTLTLVVDYYSECDTPLGTYKVWWSSDKGSKYQEVNFFPPCKEY